MALEDFAGAGGIVYRSTALGAGAVDLAAFFTLLKRNDYRGWVSLEYEGDEDPRDAIRLGLASLRKWIA